MTMITKIQRCILAGDTAMELIAAFGRDDVAEAIRSLPPQFPIGTALWHANQVGATEPEVAA